MSQPIKAYAAAGVDIDLGSQIKENLRQDIESTYRPEVMGRMGGFGGLFAPQFQDYAEPVLVSSIDGVGTKIKVASQLNRFDSIGQDLVNHCVNDIAVLGAEPLFFLDYIGASKLDPNMMKDVVKGMSLACRENNCALIGGETAQMPGVYQERDFDLVGSIVGVVDKPKIIDGSTITPGDRILGLASNGLHTNGYSLAREILFKNMGLRAMDALSGMTEPVGEALLKPHLSYLSTIKALRQAVTIKGMAHITGGGLIDNIPRILPEGTGAYIELGTWKMPDIFQVLIAQSGVHRDELYQVFNMGIGMVIIISTEEAEKARELSGGTIIGTITPGDRNVVLEEKAIRDHTKRVTEALRYKEGQ